MHLSHLTIILFVSYSKILYEFSIDFEILDGKGVDKDDKEFEYKYINVNDKQYRIPGPVLDQIKEILKVKPDQKMFKVTRTGSGLQTRYTTVQL